MLKQASVPTIWLYGKTGSGKSSIIQFLTGVSEAEVGNGYRPCTENSRLFSFPDEELPVVRFLDTRGVGEAGYDSTHDFNAASEMSQLIIVTVRARDHANDQVVGPLRKTRRAHRDRPVLLAITCLHDLYPGQQHPNPDPFDSDEVSLPSDLPNSLPDELRRSLATQFQTWEGLYDQAVAIDLTPPYEGFDDSNFGGERLKNHVIDLMPSAYRQKLIELDRMSAVFATAHQRKAHRIVLAHSITAATAAAVPAPWVDIPFVLGVQSFLAHRLARLNHHKLDAATIANVTAAIGSRVALRMGIREALKIIPWVGSIVNAAAAFAFTYATGWAWNWYFQQVNQGHVPSREELRSVYQDQLQRATELWKKTHGED